MPKNEKMTYKMYKKVKTNEEYYASWDSDSLAALNPDLKKQIYLRYMKKCEVLKRDNFSCQNADCETPTSKLTVHHIKAKRNGGEDKVRNMITICKSCHNAFNKCKKHIRFTDDAHLPAHIRGQTFMQQKPEKVIDWKKIKLESKLIRKDAKQRKLVIKYDDLNWEMIAVLLRFMQIPYTEFEDD